MNEYDAKSAPLSPRRSLRSPPLPVVPARPPPPPIPLTRHHTIAGPPPPNLRPPPPPTQFRPHATSLSSLQRTQNPPMTSVARSSSMYIPPGAILAVPANNPNSSPIPMIPYNPQSPPFVYHSHHKRTVTMNRYSSPPPPPPPPRPPLPPHFQRVSSSPARCSSATSAPLSSSTPLAPPRPPKPPELMAELSPNSQVTSPTPTSSSDKLPSAPSHCTHAPTVVEGNTGRLESQDNKFNATGSSDIAEESAPYDEHDVINQSTTSGNEAQSRSPEYGPCEAPPPAYDESMSHEVFTEDGSSYNAASTGIDATFGRPSSPRANVQEVFPVPSPPICSLPLPPTVTEPPTTPTTAEAVDETTANQTDYESAECASSSHDLGEAGQGTGKPVNGCDSNQGTFTSDQVNRDSHRDTAGVPTTSHRTYPTRPTRTPPPVPPAPSTRASPTRPPPIVTQFQRPCSSPPPSPPSPVSSRPPSPVIFNQAALGYDPTTDTRIDPFVDVSSTPPQSTFPIVRDASISKRVPTDRTSVMESPSTPVPRRRRMFSNTSVPGRERLSSLLLPMTSSSTHSDKRPQSTVVGPSHHVDLLGSGGIILEHEWTEQGGLPYCSVPDGKKKRHPPTPPIELEVLDENSITMGGGEIIDLWYGVEFGYSSPSWDIAPSLLSNKCPPSSFPSHDNPLTLYPSPSTPFFIRAPSWRALLRLLATLNQTRIEPTPEVWADMKRGTADLRLVVQFIRTPFLPPMMSGKAKNEQREVVLYLCLHREVPSIRSRIGKSLSVGDRAKWSNWDTSVLPYGFKVATGSRLAKENKPSADAWMHLSSNSVADAGTPVCEQNPDGDGSLFITLPPPFVELPATMSDLALYLQDSLVRSRRGSKHRAMTDPKGRSEDPGKTRNVLEKANKSATNLAVIAPSRPLSTCSATSTSRPSTSHSRIESATGTHLAVQRTPSLEVEVERGRGSVASEQRDAPISPQVITPQESSTPSPVTSNHSPPPQPQINPALIPGIKRLASAIKTFYPDEHTPVASQPPTEEGSGKPHQKSFLERMKNKTSHAGGALKTSIVRGRARDSNMERFELVSPWRAPGL